MASQTTAAVAASKTPITTTERQSFARLRAYVALTKPRIIELLLVTTVPPMIVAERGIPALWLMAVTVIGGTLACGGANAINMVFDRDIDSRMSRTSRRPIVTGQISARSALVFALAIEFLAIALLWIAVGWLPAVITAAGAAFYVFIYTMWLKRRSSQNIVIGGAAGAVPALVGWSAVTGELSWAAVAMFAVVFFWTPPHFWALALRHRDEYASVDVPMLPVVASEQRTTVEMMIYTVLTVVASLAIWPLADLGPLYGAAALLSGLLFVVFVGQLHRCVTDRRARRVFSFSITYLTLIFVAMAVDAVTSI